MWRGARSLLPEAAGGPRENRNPMYEHRNSFPLPVALLIMCIFMGGQNSLKKVVDDRNLTYFIIRYRYRYRLAHMSVRCNER
jgi:hypothetical protein